MTTEQTHRGLKRWGGFVMVPHDLHESPEYLRLNDTARALLAEAWSYCGRQQTDGYVPRVWFQSRRPRWRAVVAALVAAELLAEVSDENRDGFEVVGFLEVNRTRAEIETRREAERAKKRRQKQQADARKDAERAESSRGETTGKVRGTDAGTGRLEAEAEPEQEGAASNEAAAASTANGSSSSAGAQAAAARGITFEDDEQSRREGHARRHTEQRVAEGGVREWDPFYNAALRDISKMRDAGKEWEEVESERRTAPSEQVAAATGPDLEARFGLVPAEHAKACMVREILKATRPMTDDDADQLERLLATVQPSAPADALAGALLGQPNRLADYRRDEGRPGERLAERPPWADDLEGATDGA